MKRGDATLWQLLVPGHQGLEQGRESSLRVLRCPSKWVRRAMPKMEDRTQIIQGLSRVDYLGIQGGLVHP